MDYDWWLARTHLKKRRSLINDTLIHQVVEYYKEIKSPRLMNAYLLASKQVDWSGAKPKEGRSILENALQLADLNKDTVEVKNVINGMLRLYEMPQDEEKIKELVALNKKYMKAESDYLAYYNLTEFYNSLDISDSLFHYARKGIDLARERNQPYAEYGLTRLYTEALSRAGRFNEALNTLRDMERRIRVGNELKLNYISVFISMDKLDSAQKYMDMYQPILEKYKGHEEVDIVELALNSFKLVMNEKKGKYLDMNVIGKTGNNILEKSRKRIWADRERQYVQNKLLKDNLTLEIEQGRMKQRLLWFGIIVLFAIALLIFFYQRKLLKKERFVQQAHEKLRRHAIQLSENESVILENKELIQSLSEQLDESGDLKQEIDQLSAENETLSKENKILQNDMESYSKWMNRKDEEMMVYTKLVEQNARLQERERFLTAQVITHTGVLHKLGSKPHYIDEMQWPEILQAINQLFDGFSYRLRTDFPALSEEDVRYCCLIKLRLSNSVIATLTGISPSSVTKRKQRIKEKMTQQRHHSEIRKEQSLETYLWNY